MISGSLITSFPTARKLTKGRVFTKSPETRRLWMPRKPIKVQRNSRRTGFHDTVDARASSDPRTDLNEHSHLSENDLSPNRV